jgi:hypothetical protein
MDDPRSAGHAQMQREHRKNDQPFAGRESRLQQNVQG